MIKKGDAVFGEMEIVRKVKLLSVPTIYRCVLRVRSFFFFFSMNKFETMIFRVITEYSYYILYWMLENQFKTLFRQNLNV